MVIEIRKMTTLEGLGRGTGTFSGDRNDISLWDMCYMGVCRHLSKLMNCALEIYAQSMLF